MTPMERREHGQDGRSKGWHVVKRSGHQDSPEAVAVLRKRLRAVRRQLTPVQEPGDAESIHKMRVAARRLRCAIKAFGEALPARRARAWRRELRRLTRALGAARDLDVQIQFAQKHLASLEDRSLRPGVQRLLLRLGQERESRQTKVLKAARRLEAGGTLQDIGKALGVRRRRTAQQAPAADASAARLLAAREIARGVGDLRAFDGCVADPHARNDHHAMRIAAKRLRYTVEVFEPTCEGRLAASVETLKGVQELLGAIHDCDVWTSTLEAFLEEERARTLDYCGNERPLRRLAPGINHLRRERAVARERLFRDFQQLWRSLERDGFWSVLQGAPYGPTEGEQRPSDAVEPSPAPPVLPPITVTAPGDDAPHAHA